MKPVWHSRKIWILAVIIALGMAASMSPCAFGAGVGQDQKERLKDLATATRRKAQTERASLRQSRMELFRIYSDYELNERKAKAAVDKIDQAQFNLLNIHLENQIGIRKVLNADQFAGFKKLIGERMRGHDTGFAGHEPDDAIDKFIDKTMGECLNLNADQKRRAAAQMRRLIEQKSKVLRQIQRDTKQMADSYSNYDLNIKASRKLIAKIHNEQSDLLNLNLKKQKSIRSVLNESQFNALNARLADAMKKRMSELGMERRGRGRK
jgi:Spy/CpxP family protein refolding chaperone